MISFDDIIGPFNIQLSDLLHQKWCVQIVGSFHLVMGNFYPCFSPVLGKGVGEGVGNCSSLPRPLCITPLESLQKVTY